MAAERKKPLLTSDTDTDGSCKHVQLYDDMVMLEMKKTLCQGYIILLTGGMPIPEPPRKKKKKNKKKGKRAKREADDPAAVLAFAALTTGNVIDACFGVTAASRPSARAVRLIKEAKGALFAADDASESAARIAVEAYKAAFRTVLAMHARLDRLNFLTKCFNEGRIRRQASRQLESDFYMLEQIVADNK